MIEIVVIALLALTYMWDAGRDKKVMEKREDILKKCFDEQQKQMQILKEELKRKSISS